MSALQQNWLKKAILRLISGEEKAFEKIYSFYFDRLYSFCYSFTRSGSSTEDMVQDIFAGIWNNRESINPELNFEAYLFTIARNTTYNYIRQVAARQKLVISNDEFLIHPAWSESTDSKILCEEIAEATENILATMPPQRKNVYTLCRENEYTYEEVAKKLNISVNTVKTHMKLAIKSFREQLLPTTKYTIIFTYFLIRFLPIAINILL